MTTTAQDKPSARSARVKDAGDKPVPVSGVSRREFLYYIWGASMVMVLGAGAGSIIWYLLPRFRAGEFGGDFFVPAAQTPVLNSAPQDNPQGRFWFSNTDSGVAALYKVCTHLGCLFKWVGTNNRFECPCHGSKFQSNGLYIEGPAPRSLDRFELTARLNNGTEVTSDDFGLVHLDDLTQVTEFVVHTGKKIKGPGHGVSYT